MITRIITLGEREVEAIHRIGEQFYKLTDMPGEFEPKWFISVWTQVLKSGVGAFWAYEADGRIVGVLAALLHPCLFRGDTVATEAFWFVEPEYRCGFGGGRLFQTFLHWAREVGAKKVQTGHVVNSIDVDLNDFYTRQGFRKLETIYVKELE